MKSVALSFIFGAFLLLFVMPANSTLSCEVAATCGYTTMFRISDPADGHAELANESNYNNLVCCRELNNYFVGTGCTGTGATLLKLSGNSNAHAEQNNESNYNVNACINTTISGVSVGYDTSCSSYDTCVASISGSINAHVGNCTAYSTKVCATASINPVEISFVSPTEPNRMMSDRNYTYVNVSTINASSVYVDWNNSLIGYWNFDNSTADLSSYNNNGTNNGADCSKTTLGSILYACRFDGIDDFINISDAASLNLTYAYTIEARIKMAAFSNNTVLDKDNGYAMGINRTGTIYVWHNGTVVNSTSNLSLDTWYYIAATYSGSAVRLYINGAENASSTGTVNSLSQTARDLYIGVNNSANTVAANTYFNGIIDEVRIWNRVLSAREINASYNASARLERNFTSLNDGVYNYYAVAIGAVGNRNTTETRNVTVRHITPLITGGNNSAVGTENYQSSNLTVTFYQPSANTYASNVRGRIWVETNAGAFDIGHDCTSNSNGNCTVEFLPTCDYTSGQRRFRGGVFGDSVYNLTNSTDGFITIDTAAYCLNKVSFSLEFNISDSQNDHAEIDNKTEGLYRPHQLNNYYACLEDTSLANIPAFGIVFSGRTLDYINLTAGNSYMMKMSQHQMGNKFLIPATKNGCTAIRSKMNIIQAFGVMTQAFASTGASGSNPIEVVLSYPGMDIIGNITKSGAFTMNIEKNESSGIVQMVFRD